MTSYPYIHLRTQSSYSLAESAIKVNKLVELAFRNNMPAIALVDNNNMQSGYHTVTWNADAHSSGVYFVKMIVGDKISTQKLLLVK